VLHREEVVGYTIGNDVSSRSIEGENPLYLPQAKVYDKCCSVGPCVATPEVVDDPHDLGMTLTIERDGEVLFEDSTSTSEMATTCEKLVSYLRRHNDLPETVVLLTGTALVPPESFTLAEGDQVTIDIDRIGQLVNDTVEV
jgi:2-dehydro-3-deoxy-D-arabinonate dehydratase